MSVPIVPSDPLVERWACLVRVSGFTFQFTPTAQVRERLDHFTCKLHPSGRFKKLRPVNSVHWYRPSYKRLPMWLFEEPKRCKVVKVLQKALV